MTVNDPADNPLGHAGSSPVPELVRSEEQLHVTSVRVPIERVRVLRRIVTETRTLQVQVRREELHIERLPVTSSDPLPPQEGADSPSELTIVLSEEVPAVTMTTRPVERVRVHIDTVTHSQAITAPLRHEQISVDRDERLSP